MSLEKSKSTRGRRARGHHQTKRSPKRLAKARIPKLVEVFGHRLTPEQNEEFERETKDRYERHPSDGWHAAETFALRNVLYRRRPSVQAGKRFERMDLYDRAMDAVMVLGTFRGHAFTSLRLLRVSSELVAHVADELRAVEQELRTTQAGIEREIRGEEGLSWLSSFARRLRADAALTHPSRPQTSA